MPKSSSSCVALALVLSCFAPSDGCDDPPRTPERAGEKSKERIVSFHEAFDRQPLSPLLRYEVADASRLAVVETPARRGAGALQIRIEPGDRVAKKNRAEIKLFPNDPAGSEGWYAWSFLIPDDYAEAPTPELFQIIGQWHDQPPPGKTWNDYAAHPPVLAVKYGTRGARRGIQISYGLAGKSKGPIAEAEIEKGKWVDLVFHVRWSLEDDGFVEVFKDGEPLTPRGADGHKVFGRNMYNESPNYLKLGIYRADGFATENRIYFDELALGRTREELAPR